MIIISGGADSSGKLKCCRSPDTHRLALAVWEEKVAGNLGDVKGVLVGALSAAQTQRGDAFLPCEDGRDLRLVAWDAFLSYTVFKVEITLPCSLLQNIETQWWKKRYIPP